MRKKRLLRNTISSLVYQVTNIVCGFILPRIILIKYGSEVNGLISSITQFLSVISFLDMGVGTVVESALYNPLARKDNLEVSRIISSANKFFRRLAIILLFYIGILIIFYPYISNSVFSWGYIAVLIIAIGVDSFAQYYYGMTDRLLLSADQRGYVSSTIRIITLILNTVVCVILIYAGASIQSVKIMTSIIFLARPIILRLYVNRFYRIDRKIKYEGEPIKQKWNGLAQHIASVVLNSTDLIILTIFATLSDVSVYSVYHMVIMGIMHLVISTTNGLQSLMGELLAKKESEYAKNVFEWMEWILHTMTVLVFGCTGVLLIPFVRVYTFNITDTNYIQPIFSLLITLAYAIRVLRLPYNILILAAGHFKDTQSNYIFAAVINIVLSIFLVWQYGLVGVAIGTLVAMLYQTIWMLLYDAKNILDIDVTKSIRQTIIDIIIVIVAALLTKNFELQKITYLSWGILAIKVGAVWLTTVIGINLVCNKEKLLKAIKSLTFFSKGREKND